MKIIYVNCAVKNYMKGDHRSYRRKSCVYNCEDLLSYNYAMLCYVMLCYVSD